MDKQNPTKPITLHSGLSVYKRANTNNYSYRINNPIWKVNERKSCKTPVLEEAKEVARKVWATYEIMHEHNLIKTDKETFKAFAERSVVPPWQRTHDQILNKMLLDSGSEIISIVPVTINQISAFAIVSLEQLYFYSQKGELIDQLGEESGFPLGVTAIANTGDGIVVKTAKGMLHYNIEQYSWQEIQFIQEPNWSLLNKVNQQQIAKAKQNYRAQYLTLERIILDAHSGRIAGLMGVLFMDAVAVLLILLSLSGIYIWLRYANNKR